MSIVPVNILRLLTFSFKVRHNIAQCGKLEPPQRKFPPSLHTLTGFVYTMDTLQGVYQVSESSMVNFPRNCPLNLGNRYMEFGLSQNLLSPNGCNYFKN